MMATRKCSGVRALLSAYLDGELGPKKRLAVESHLRDCASCAAELETLRATSAFFCDLPEDELPDDFHAVLKRRVRAEGVAAGAGVRRSSERRGRAGIFESLGQVFRRPSLRGVAVTACLMVLVVWAGGFALHMGVPIPGQHLFGLKSSAPDGDLTRSGTGALGVPSDAPGGYGSEEAGADGLGGSDGASDALRLDATEDRKIVLNAHLTLTCEDVAVTKDRAVAAATGVGGFVEQLTSWKDDRGTWASMLLRVPTGSLADVMGHLTTMGDTVSEQISRQDVTAQYVDLTARLNNLRLQEQRLLVLVGRAVSLSDILVLESELTRIRTDIERQERTLRGLEERVSYSTVNLTLQPVAGLRPGAGLWERIVDAFLQSWAWLGRMAEGFVVLMARALPVLALLTLAGLVFVSIRSRRQRAGL